MYKHRVDNLNRLVENNVDHKWSKLFMAGPTLSVPQLILVGDESFKKRCKGSWLGNDWKAVKGRTWKKLSMCQSHGAAYKWRAALLLRNSYLLWSHLSPPKQSYDWHQVCVQNFSCATNYWKQHTFFCVSSASDLFSPIFTSSFGSIQKAEGNLWLFPAFQLLSTLFLFPAITS